MRILIVWLIALSSMFAADAPTREVVIARIADGFAKLNERYWSPTLGIWFDRPGDDLRAHFEGRHNPPWWPSANAVETLLDAAKATGDAKYQATAETLYSLNREFKNKAPRLIAELQRRKQWSAEDDARQKRREAKAAVADTTGYYTEFRNEYLDDSGWWAIAWLKMYDRTQDKKYLTTSKAIHAHMAKNWRPDKGGGVMWCEDADKLVPNAITNQLFAMLSARLFARTQEPEYLKWAERTLEWTRANALYDGIAIVDGPGHRGDHWTTNQGTYIGMLVSLFEATKQTKYLDEASKFTTTALIRAGLTKGDGVLFEKLGTSGDASLFKGVFARYLGQLRDVLNAQKLHPETVQQIARTLRASVASLLSHGVGKDGFFRTEWHEGAKEQSLGFNAQLSGIAVLVASLGSKE